MQDTLSEGTARAAQLAPFSGHRQRSESERIYATAHTAV
jgi:hypothetical protein